MTEEMQPVPLSYRRRQLILALGLFLLFAFLIAQFYRIQVLQSSKWQDVADRQHHFVIEEAFKRGTFYAAGGPGLAPTCLAMDIQKYHLYVDPQSISESAREALGVFISSRLELDPVWIQAQLERRSRSRLLLSWLPKEQRDEILRWWYPFAKEQRLARNALYFVSDYKRSYPYGPMLGQVLHTIQDRKDEKTQQAHPTGGLELEFNSVLSGSLGKRRLVRSPRNAFEMGELIQEPIDGADVHLTVDVVLQSICEEEISKAVENSKARAGWAVMMDPFSGEILALAQYPFFEPARYRDFFNDSELVGHTKVKAITDAFEPGSTMKPLTMAVCLQANRLAESEGLAPYFDPEEKIASADGRFPGRTRPISDVTTHAYLNMYMALQRSSNIYMARVVDRVISGRGEQWYRDALSDYFALGKVTGLELPAESSGVLPRPGSSRSAWSRATPYSLAFGYNLQVTSLQMLRAYAILANGGYQVDPTLVRKVLKGHDDGASQITLDGQLKGLDEKQRILSSETVAEVVRGMKFASKPGGAARRGDLPGYTQAAKTGTTKKLVAGTYSSEKYFATFVGFAPAEHPRLVLLIALDEPAKEFRPGQGMGYYGGVCAAPVFRKIAKRSLEYLGVPKDDPFGYQVEDPRYDPLRADWVAETRRLRDLYAEWNPS